MKIRCVKCEHSKAACLFTPRELGQRYPMCRMCVSKQNNQSKGRSGKKYKGTEMWRVSMKRHFL